MTDAKEPGWEQVERLVGVYDANGGIVGETAYVMGKVFGRAHCSLCDITHSPVRRKREWDVLVAGLGVEFDLVHLNERDPALRSFTETSAPCVVAVLRDGRMHLLLAGEQLEELRGSVDAFELALQAAVMRLPQGA